MPIRSQFETEAEWLEHLRSWFAGQALAGFLANPGTEGQLVKEASAVGYACYKIADALLSHRETKP